MKRIDVVGRVGRVPARRSNAKGTVFYEFSVAVNSKESTFWVSVIIHERFSKIVEYLEQGRSVFISGDFSLSVYKGEPSCTIYADNVQLLGSKNDSHADVVARNATESDSGPY